MMRAKANGLSLVKDTRLRRIAPGIGGALLIVAALIAVLFMSLPLVALWLRGIESRGWEGLPGISQALGLSLLTTSIAAFITVIFGTPLAYILARWQFRGKAQLNLIVELPIVLPPAVAGLALLVTFGRRGLLGSTLESLDITLAFTTAAVVIAQIFVAAPFYIRSAQLGFSGVPDEVEDAARVDGANGWQVFQFITLPLSQRALIAGLILSWTRALGEFGATILFAGSLPGTTQTMPLLVYNVLERDLDAAIWAGVLLVGFALVALLVARSLLKPVE